LKVICVLCEKEDSTSEFRQTMTKQLDKWLIECARKLMIAQKTRVNTLPFLETVRCHPDFQLIVNPYYTELSGRNNDTVQPHHIH
jgi:uncharacterized protein YlaI